MNSLKHFLLTPTFFVLIICSFFSANVVAEGEKQAVKEIKENQEALSTSDTVVLKTNRGDIVIELAADKAPLSVANFKQYIESGYYDGTIFHRVIPGFMIQGGGFEQNMSKKDTLSSIKNEADNGLENIVGSIAMARTNDPDSATSQFFINVNDNKNLDHKAKNQRGWGYAVFGQVVEGLDVVMAISTQATSSKGRFRDVPVDTVIIEKVVFR